MDYKNLGGERKSRERKKIKKFFDYWERKCVWERERLISPLLSLGGEFLRNISFSLLFFFIPEKVKRFSLVIWSGFSFFFHFFLKKLWLQADLGLQLVVFLHLAFKTERLRCLLSVESSFSWSCSSWMRKSSKRLFTSKNFKFFIFIFIFTIIGNILVMTDYWLIFCAMWCENKLINKNRLEQESGFFFNMKYFEDEVHNGNWDEVEKYLSGFTKVDDNRYSMKIFFEIRKQKYLEALDK